MGNYTERYEYDQVGNIFRMIHQAASGGWTRRYAYNEPSLIESGTVNNRLSRTSLPGDLPGVFSAPYEYDAHGNMTRMPHLPLMRWDDHDQLQTSSKQVVNNGGTPEMTYYVYDASGQRVRKVTEGQAPAGSTLTRMQERLYLGGFEIYREYESDGNTRKLERERLHIMDDKRRIALVETKTLDTTDNTNLNASLIRYQYDNHLGSACLELDEAGNVISYEEYYPYGSTSYQAGRNAAEVGLKRYRYTGKERDGETGLYYHGARYYAPWLGKWTACDPQGIGDGANIYAYVKGNPINLHDPNGKAARSWLTTGIGILQVVGGGLEIAAGAAGIAAPTGVTQVLGVVAVAHGADTVWAGLRTIYDGNQVQQTYTQQAATSLARRAGATDATAERIGAGVDLAAGVIPSAGIGLARAAVTRGAVELTTQTATHAAPQAAAQTATHAAPQAAAQTATHAAPQAAARASESLLRVQAVQALERTVQRQGTRLANAIAQRNTAFLQRVGLSAKQINILLNRQTARPFAAIYGQAMERLVGRSIRSSPLLSRLFEHIGNRAGVAVAGRGRPDWMGRGLMQGTLVDLTTVAGRASHYARYYGEKMLVLTYTRP